MGRHSQRQIGVTECSVGEPWGGGARRPNRWTVSQPDVKNLSGGVTQTIPHAKNFLESIRTRRQPNATVERGHEAVRTLHLANISYHKGARAVLAEDGKTVTV